MVDKFLYTDVLRFYPPLFGKNHYQTNMLLLGGYVHVLYTVPVITVVSFPLHVQEDTTCTILPKV